MFALRHTLPVAVLSAVIACDTDSLTEIDTAASESQALAIEQTEVAADSEPAHGSDADASLAARVLLAFASDPRIDGADFDVSAENGVVTISTTTRSADQWTAASSIADALEGVVEVRTTTPRPPASEGDTRDHIESPDLAAFRSLGTRRDVEPVLPDPGEDEDLAARAASGDRPRTARVEAGDSLSIIASRTMGDGNQWHRIYELNRSTIGPNPERLVEGMILRIPQD